MYSPAAGMFGLCSHFLPTFFIAAKLSKENAAACTNKEKKLMETEKQSTQNTADDDSKQASVAVSAQSTSSEEDHKPQTPKEEEKPTEEERGTNEEEKGEDKKMEVDPCSETAASSDEKGKCLKLNDLSLNFRFSLIRLHVVINRYHSPFSYFLF